MIFKTARLSLLSASKQSANRLAIPSDMIRSKDGIEVGSYLKTNPIVTVDRLKIDYFVVFWGLKLLNMV